MKKIKLFYECDFHCLMKTFKIMRITVFLLLVSILQTFANDAYSQKTRLSLDFSKTKLVDVFDEIEERSEFFFLFNEKLVNTNREVNASFDNQKIDKILDLLFEGTDVVYTITDRKIILAPSYLSKTDTQQTSVSGTVTDEAGSPLPGVTVFIKGTTNGTVTNTNGNYTISNVPENAILQFSFMGMLSQEIKVGNQTTIDIILVVDAIFLEEVVAIGYGTMRKSDLTGSVSNVSEDVIKQIPINSPDQILRGQVSGVNVRMTTAEPGAPVTIRIRGVGSITSDNDPLYVIDGVPVGTGGLQTINPNDITSVDVLKDASATAIYGARGANGVIIITTKTGRYGQETKFSYDGYYGIQEVSRKYPMMNRDEIIEYARATNDNANFDTGKNVYFPESIPNSDYPDIDYQDLIFQTAPVQSHQLSARGGSDKVRYYFSGNYFNQQGIVKYSNWDRYSFKSNVEAVLTPKLKIGNYITYSYSDQDKSWTHTTTHWTGNNVVGQALMAYPFEPVFNDDGSYRYNNEISVPLLQNRGRPIPDIEGINNNFRTSRLLANVYLEYEIKKDLVFKTSLAIDEINSKQNRFHSTISHSGRLRNGMAYVNQNQRSLLVNENTINWIKSINDIHDFNVVGGATYQVIASTGFNGTSQGFINDAVATYAMGSGTEYSAPNNSRGKSTLASFFGRVNYKLFNKYLITFTARADGSSKFGPNKKWGLFPSGAVSWRANEEDFIKNLNLFSNLKLRASYGVTGNQEIGSYNSLSRLGIGLYPINESTVNTMYVNRFANEDLKWETTSQFDIGTDIGFLENKLNLTFDYYHKKTTDLLLNVELPYSSGFNSTLQNTGSVENKGIELALNAVIIDKSFHWDVTGNFHLNRNEIVDLGLSNPFYAAKPSSLWFIQSPLIDEGISLGAFQGWVQDGLFKNQSDLDAWLANMKPEVVNDLRAYPGFPKIVDVNGDGRINTEDITTIGDPYPDYEFGITNQFKYKGFDFSFFFQGMIGHDILNVLNGQTTTYNFLRYNQQKRVVGNYWTEDNQDARYIKPSEKIKPMNPQRGTDYNLIEDGSFVRLKNVSLGYTFKKLKFAESARIYGNIVNALTFTNYYGFDPEVNDHGELGGSMGLNWGIDASSYPQSRTYTFGLNITF
jgi:TonB-dependent starch-binding outer membrane protein SusC